MGATSRSLGQGRKDLITELFRRQKTTALRLRSSGFEERVEHLRQLKQSLITFEDELCEAVFLDFGKSRSETRLTEIYPTKLELNTAIQNVRAWMRPQLVPTPVLLGWGESSIRSEPKGCALIVAPWNYPVQLALTPLIGALAAGCTAIVKPSELVPNTSRVLKKMIDSTFAPEHIVVVEGGVEISKALMDQPFDHIFFTGSTEVGKLYMQAAARHLSSVTLELGGKSPAVVEKSADISLAAQKIVWGKFINAGQTCVAPDYLYVDAEVWPKLRKALIDEVQKLYPPELKNRDLAQIINHKHFQRVQRFVEQAIQSGAEVICGGKTDASTRKIEPFIFCPSEKKIGAMSEEIFGPVLPVLTYKNLNEALQFINGQEKPLAFYIFSQSNQVIENILQNTSSGGVCINETLLHLGNHHLPFGGVNHSGLGSYHGIHSFKAFSHERAVYRQTFLGRLMSLFYPPYTQSKEERIAMITRIGR